MRHTCKLQAGDLKWTSVGPCLLVHVRIAFPVLPGVKQPSMCCHGLPGFGLEMRHADGLLVGGEEALNLLDARRL